MTLDASKVLAVIGQGALKRTGSLVWYPGAPSVGEEGGLTFSRTDVAGAGYARDRTGNLRRAEGGVPRVDWLDLDGDGVNDGASILLERAGENVVANPNTFSSWTAAAGTPTATSGQSDPTGGTSAWLLEDNDGAAAEAFSSACTFTGDGEKALSLRMKAGTAGGTTIGLRDTTAAAWRHLVNVTWTDGVPSLATSVGSGTLFTVKPLASGWYEIAFSATGVVAANTNEWRLFPAGQVNADTGTVYAYIAQAENATFPSSATTTSRNAEDASLALPPALAAPVAASYYVRWRQPYGTNGGLSTPRIFQVGATDDSNARLILYWFSSTQLRAQHQTADGNVASTITFSAAAGEDLEAVVRVRTDGSVELSASRDEGTATAGSQSSALDFASAWSSATLRLNGNGSSFRGVVNLRDVVLYRGVPSGSASDLMTAFRNLPLLAA